ncbi:hypothetical protein, partial [Facilibium subflavum]|uniref:hypothetical protein n=1 Tax=Facilibium subflavum TaxID=2219058 RepID=UPI001AAC560C
FMNTYVELTLATTYNLASSSFGGFTPVLLLLLSNAGYHYLLPLLYVTFGALVILAINKICAFEKNTKLNNITFELS